MALYKDGSFLTKTSQDVFDAIHTAGEKAPYPGIYRCPGCGHEIGIAAGHTLPSQNHHQHTLAQGKVRWQLIVSHKSYPKN
jgi:hypothetical protein